MPYDHSAAQPPTRKQLAYLRSLANRTGGTFTNPRTSAHASAEIRRLKAINATGFTFAELEAEEAARAAHGDPSCAVHDFELDGFGSNASWSQRS